VLSRRCEASVFCKPKQADGSNTVLGGHLFRYWRSSSKVTDSSFELIERLWHLLRGQLTKNQFYETLEHLCQAVYEWLTTVPFAQFCLLMGIDETGLVFV